MVLRTTVAGELDVSSAEQLDQEMDAEYFFFSFEPDEFLRRARVKLTREATEKLASQVYLRYEMALREILARMSHRKESNTDAVNAAEHAKDDAATR